MEPVRVKVYGLFSFTKRRYWIQTLGVELPGAVLAFAAWYFALRPWSDYYHMHPPPKGAEWLSVYLTVLLAVFDNLPWILLAALALKAMEVYIVLRIFARKEAQAAAKKPGA